MDYVARLRQAITSGNFMPNEHLVEKDLVGFLGTNRVNVRTALARLEEEGLVILERNRGARVRLMSAPEAIQNIEIRAALEALAARHAARNATPSDMQRLRSIMEQLSLALEDGDLLHFANINVVLHDAIVQASQHALASSFIAMLKAQSVGLQYSILQPGRAESAQREHTEIIAAIEAEDPARAEAAMREHLEHAVDALRSVIQGGNWRAFDIPR